MSSGLGNVATAVSGALGVPVTLTAPVTTVLAAASHAPTLGPSPRPVAAAPADEAPAAGKGDPGDSTGQVRRSTQLASRGIIIELPTFPNAHRVPPGLPALSELKRFERLALFAAW